MVLIPDALGSTATNLSIERVAEPYYEFVGAGHEVVFCSPEGGAPLIAARSGNRPAAVTRLLADGAAREALSDTLLIDQIHPEDFEAAFCIGVPGAIWIAGEEPASRLIAQLLRAGKPVAIIPSHVDLEPNGSHDGLLILGERNHSPRPVALALLGALASN